eukprot:15327207-Ditylum_brightwellii.AAC.1
MFQTTYDINYKNNVCKYSKLMCIYGDSKTSSILALCNQVKPNAQSVHPTLSGGANGHLELVVDPSVYVLILNITPYARHALLVLTLPAGGTQYKFTQACKTYNNGFHIFNEANVIERALMQHIIIAVEAKKLKAICNPVVHKITRIIPYIWKTSLGK